MANRLEFRAIRRSELQNTVVMCDKRQNPPDVIVLDTIGELQAAVGLGDIVFAGGSLVSRGGQNPIEAAVHSKAILMGTSVFNFEEIVAAFRSEQAIVMVTDASDLVQRAAELLANPSRRDELGRRAVSVVRRRAGGAQEYSRIIEQFVRVSGCGTVPEFVVGANKAA